MATLNLDPYWLKNAATAGINTTAGITLPGQIVVSSGTNQAGIPTNATAPMYTINITQAENGYIIAAYHLSKSVTRVASSEDLQEQIAAALASLKME